MLDASILRQVTEIFGNLEANYTLSIELSPSRNEGGALVEFLNDFASTSQHLQVEQHSAEGDTLCSSLLKDGAKTGVSFRGIPNGHEFTSLLLAILNADGKGKNLPDEGIARRVRALKGDIRLQT